MAGGVDTHTHDVLPYMYASIVCILPNGPPVVQMMRGSTSGMAAVTNSR
jgi:hypothetical protein